MVLDAPDLRLCRQQMVEMAAPARGVLAPPKPANLGPIQHGLDTARDPARRFRFGVQIGSKTFVTSAVSIACMDNAPSTGSA